MKFTIDRLQFSEALSRLAHVAPEKHNLPILTNILMDISAGQLTMTATDLETGLKITLPCEQEEAITTSKDEHFIIAVHGKLLAQFVRALSGDTVTCEADFDFDAQDHRLHVTAEQSSLKLATLPADDYPAFVKMDDIEFMNVEAAELQEALEHVLFAASNDENRFNLNAVLFEMVTSDEEQRPPSEHLIVVATDGHRLAHIKRTVVLPKTGKVLLPKAQCITLQKMLDGKDTVDVGFDEKNVIVKTDDFILTLRFIHAEYPDWRRVTPDKAKLQAQQLRVNRAALMQALRRVQVLSTKENRSVSFEVEGNATKLSTRSDTGAGRDAVECVNITDFQAELLFNVTYLLDGLGVFSCDEVEMRFADGGGPLVIAPVDDPDLFNLVMPMRK